MHIGRSRSSKVIDFGTNLKRIRDFLLVCHSNLVLSCLVSETLQLFCSETDPHPLFTRILGVFPLDQIAHVGVNLSMYLKLFGRKIILEAFEPV